MLLMSVLSSVAWPCAGLFHDTDTLAESDAQMAIFEATEDGTRVSYQVEYDGDAADFGWLIPIFGAFVSLEETDRDRFTNLYDHTQPIVEYFYDDDDGSGGGLGCGSGAKSGGVLNDRAYDTASNSVDVVAEGFTGSYSYTVLESDSSKDFLAWLGDNGWSSGGAEGAIDAYIKEGGVQFVAIKLTEAGGDELPPISVSYSGDQMRFPATMARSAMSDTVRTVAFVRGDGTATISSGWDSEDIDQITGSTADSPTHLYDEALLALGGVQRGYGVVYSGPDETGAGWVTRFETLAEPAAHVEDAVFSVTDSQSSVHTTVALYESGGTSHGWMLLPLVALGAGATRRRWR